MDHFAYRDGQLFCEDVPVAELAEHYGTPLYVYSEATLVHHLTQIQKAFAPANPIICYSVKANGNLSICRLMGQHGADFDVTRHWAAKFDFQSEYWNLDTITLTPTVFTFGAAFRF